MWVGGALLTIVLVAVCLWALRWAITQAVMAWRDRPTIWRVIRRPSRIRNDMGRLLEGSGFEYFAVRGKSRIDLNLFVPTHGGDFENRLLEANAEAEQMVTVMNTGQPKGNQ